MQMHNYNPFPSNDIKIVSKTVEARLYKKQYKILQKQNNIDKKEIDENI